MPLSKKKQQVVNSQGREFFSFAFLIKRGSEKPKKFSESIVLGKNHTVKIKRKKQILRIQSRFFIKTFIKKTDILLILIKAFLKEKERFLLYNKSGLLSKIL